MAHRQKLDFGRFYRRMTIGQLFMLDNDLIEFLVLTNPFGSGDETVTDGKPDRGTPVKKRVREIVPTADVAHNIATQIRQKYPGDPLAAKLIDKGHVSVDELPPKVRMLLDDLEKGRDGRN